MRDRFDQIAQTETTKSGRRYRVSTVKRTIEGDDRISYETFVFPGDSYREVYGDHYATRTDAMKGHAALVSKYSD